MIERVPPALRGLNEDVEVGARLLLPDELGERLRADRRLEGVRFALCRTDEAVGHGLFVAVFAAAVKPTRRTIPIQAHKMRLPPPGSL